MIRVGGSSYNNGIRFIGEKYHVSFKDVHGKTQFVIGKNVVPDTSRIMYFLNKLPLVRGFINVICKNKYLFIILATDLVLNIITLGRESSTVSTSSELETLLIVLSFISIFSAVTLALYMMSKLLVKMKDAWMYHGAEHKVIETNYAEKEINYENCKAAARVSDNCGTMLVSLMLFVYIVFFSLQLIFKVYLWSSVELILMVTISYELFRAKRTNVILKPIFKLGYLLQEHFFTKEPNDHQLAQAMVAFSILEGLETGEFSIEDVNEVLTEVELAS